MLLPELYYHILLLCNGYTRENCRVVCKLFNKIVTDCIAQKL